MLCFVYRYFNYFCIYILPVILLLVFLFLHYPPCSFSDGVNMSCVVWYPCLYVIILSFSSYSYFLHHDHSVVSLWHMLCGITNLISFVFIFLPLILTLFTMLIQWWFDYVMCSMVLLFSISICVFFSLWYCSQCSFSDGATMLSVVW